MSPKAKEELKRIAKHFYKKPKRKVINGTISDEELKRLQDIIKELPSKKTFIPCL